MNVTEKLKFVSGREENIVRKRKYWLPAFSPFPTMFSKSYLFKIVKSKDCVIKSLKQRVVGSFRRQILDSQTERVCRRQF